MTEFEIESVYALSPEQAWEIYGEVLKKYANGKIIVDNSRFDGFKIIIKIKTVSQLQLLVRKIGRKLILDYRDNCITIYDDYME